MLFRSAHDVSTGELMEFCRGQDSLRVLATASPSSSLDASLDTPRLPTAFPSSDYPYTLICLLLSTFSLSAFYPSLGARDGVEQRGEERDSTSEKPWAATPCLAEGTSWWRRRVLACSLLSLVAEGFFIAGPGRERVLSHLQHSSKAELLTPENYVRELLDLRSSNQREAK